jgi:EmrB/QacA subfamily drug resistance transporter
VERKWWTLLASCTAIFMLLLDVTIVNVALPSIERGLGADFSDLQWVIDAYALTLAGVLLAAGSLADKVGRRLVFTLGLAIFTASSLACGLARDPLFLQLSRAAQGIGGAMMFGTSLALIAQEFQGRERGTALGVWGATTAVAVSTGPLVGGALVDALSWRWIFFVNVPIGLAGLAVARLRLRESRDPAASGVDIGGVALLCPALFLLVYGLIRGNDEGWGSALINTCFTASALLLVLFVVVERRADDPLLDLSLFRKPAFTGVMIAGFALSASIFSMFLYITLFFQNVLGFSPFEAGLRSLPVTMPILFTSPLSGRLTARVPVRLLLGTGLALVTVGLLLIGNLSDSSGWTALLPGQIVAGIGIGLATPALASTAVGVVGPQLSGMASGASNTARQLGLATGIAGLGSIFQSKIESTFTPLVAGTPGSSPVHELARAVASGGTARALRAVPPAAHDKVANAAHHAFVTGFNTIALVSVAVAAVGCVAGYALVRSRDFVGGGSTGAGASVGRADGVRLDHPRPDHGPPVMTECQPALRAVTLSLVSEES